MARDAIVVLQNLECLSQQESPQDPYIWPVLVWIDGASVDGTVPVLGDSRVVLKEGMRPGDVAGIPYPLGTLGHRFEDDASLSYLLVAVLVWARRGTPADAVWAGYEAFSDALPAAVRAHFSGLADPATRRQTTDLIKQSVSDSIQAAISAALTWEQKILVGIGDLQLDLPIGGDFYVSSDLAAADFTLAMSDKSGNSYAVHGGLRVRLPVVDLCQAQADQITVKQKNVDALVSQITQLQQDLQHAPPGEKSYIVAEIKLAGKELVIAQGDLANAQAALKACRDHWADVVATVDVSPGTSTFPGL